MATNPSEFTLDDLSLPVISNALPQVVVAGQPQLSLTYEDMGEAPVSEEATTDTPQSKVLQVAGGFVAKLGITSIRTRMAQLNKSSPKYQAWINQEKTLSVLQNVSIVSDSSTGATKEYSACAFSILEDATGTLPYVKIQFEFGYDVNGSLVNPL